MNNQKRTAEKNQLFEDVFNGKTPKRVPILSSGDNSFCLGYVGFDLRREQYSIEKNLEAIEKTTKDFDTDSIFATMVRIPQMYKILGAKNFVMGGDGFLQHPEVTSLNENDYEDLVADPFKTICDKALPQIYSEFGKEGFEGKSALDVYKRQPHLWGTIYRTGAARYPCTVDYSTFPRLSIYHKAGFFIFS